MALRKSKRKKAFLKKARDIHGEKFDYSAIKYESMDSKISLVCPEHGQFTTTCRQHLGIYAGCVKCRCDAASIHRSKSREECIKLARAAHGNKYDYSKFQLPDPATRKRDNAKVTIICPEHGEFKIRCSAHIYQQKQGCSRCAYERKQKSFDSTEEFVDFLTEKFGKDYDYSEVEYVSGRDKFKVVCKIHGEFFKTPYGVTRLSKHPVNSVSLCPSCNVDRSQKKKRATTEEFIAKARKVHGDKYDYSCTDYRGYHQKVKIRCPEHGEFRQTPQVHYTSGCPKCTKENLIQKRLEKNGQKLTDKIKSLYGEKYSKIVYNGSSVEASAYCTDHGNFKFTPRHARKQKFVQICKKCPPIHPDPSMVARDNSLSARKARFIEKSKEVHGDTYDYSEVNYVNINTKVKIVCPTHGAWQVLPPNHASRKSGCPSCANLHNAHRMRYTSEEFIAKARKVHGDKYDYSCTDYRGNHQKVKIRCPEHGEFEITPVSHCLSPSRSIDRTPAGCPRCLKEVKRNFFLQKHIERAKKLHEGKYDYSRVPATASITEDVEIVCLEHGVYKQTMKAHLSTLGCPKCSKISASKKSAMGIENFISKAKIVHGDKYDYTSVKYIRTRDPVDIICPEHGKFEQSPNSHLHKGAGCPLCANHSTGLLLRSTTEEFVEKAKIVHGDKYDYTSVKYITTRDPVDIICPEHGSFRTLPSSHLNSGVGCHLCSERNRISKPEREWLDYLGLAEDSRHRQVKILTNSGKRYVVDGYNPETKTVYEFNGDYWHGNPKKYPPHMPNLNAEKTYGELHERTLEREANLISSGYKVVSIWESDWYTLQEGLKED